MLWTVDLLNFVPLTHVTQALSGHITCNISKNRLVYLGEDTGYFAHLNLALSTDLKKNSRFTQFILGCLSRQNFYNSKDRLMGSNLSPSLSPCLSSGNHSLVLFQEVIKGFDCKINGRFHGVKLLPWTCTALAGWTVKHWHKHRELPQWLCFSIRIWADALLLDMSLTQICCSARD